MVRPIGSRNAAPRLDRKVIRRTLAEFPAPTPQPTDCRLWQGSCWPNGYGKKWDPERQQSIGVHKWVWEQVHGPTDLDVLHKCDNPPCYRYDHLFEGTAKDNNADMTAKGREGGRFRPGASATVKLTPDDVAVIRQRLAEGETMSAIARDYDVNPTTILAIRERRNWGHL